MFIHFITQTSFDFREQNNHKHSLNNDELCKHDVTPTGWFAAAGISCALAVATCLAAVPAFAQQSPRVQPVPRAQPVPRVQRNPALRRVPSAPVRTNVRSIRLTLPGHKRPVRVRYIARRGRAIFQGDIDLGPVRSLGKPKLVGKFSSSRKRSGIGSTSQPLLLRAGDKYLWPGGVVPFSFDSNTQGPQAGRPVLRTQINTAINFWNNNTNLRFIRRTNENDRIRFKIDSGIPGTGQSKVGRQGGRQDIKLKIGAGSGTIIHEIGHAIGLWHEQSRMDRDSFVQIVWDNVRGDAKHNFDKHVGDGIDFGPYDVRSTMHYGSRTFARRDPLTGQLLTTIRSRVPGVIIAPSGTLSALDIAGINRIYPVNACGRIPLIFEHDNRRGKQLSLEYSKPNLKDQKFNDKASSICVPSGWTVTAFEDTDFRGRSIRFPGPTVITDLKRNRPGGRDWGDKFSSIRVSGAQANPTPVDCNANAVIFEHDHFRGRRMSLAANVADLHQFRLGDKISSVCVPAGRTISLFQHKGYEGESITLTGPLQIHDLKRESPDRINWGDTFSSARLGGANVNRPPAICNNNPVLFADDNFRGVQLDVSRQARDIHQHNFGDKASSVCVPRGWRVVLFEHKDFRGRSLSLTGPVNIRDMKRDRPSGRDWGDKISSMRVTQPPGTAEISCTNPTLYEHDSFRGRQYPIRRTIRDMHPFGTGDKASSVCVPSGWRVTLFEDKRFRGRTLNLVGPRNIRDLKRDRPGGRDWGDKVSSVRVTAPPGTPGFLPCNGPLFYHDDHYRGRSFSITASNTDVHRQGNGDKASSVCIPAGFSVTIFEHKNFRGRSLRLNGPREILDLKRNRPGGRDWGDKISSVRVN